MRRRLPGENSTLEALGPISKLWPDVSSALRSAHPHSMYPLIFHSKGVTGLGEQTGFLCRIADDVVERETDAAGNVYLTVQELMQQEQERRAGAPPLNTQLSPSLHVGRHASFDRLTRNLKSQQFESSLGPNDVCRQRRLQTATVLSLRTSGARTLNPCDSNLGIYVGMARCLQLVPEQQHKRQYRRQRQRKQGRQERSPGLHRSALPIAW